MGKKELNKRFWSCLAWTPQGSDSSGNSYHYYKLLIALFHHTDPEAKHNVLQCAFNRETEKNVGDFFALLLLGLSRRACKIFETGY